MWRTPVTLPPLFQPPSSFALARPVNDDVVALAEDVVNVVDVVDVIDVVDVVDVDVADDVVTLPPLFLPPSSFALARPVNDDVVTVCHPF